MNCCYQNIENCLSRMLVSPFLKLLIFSDRHFIGSLEFISFNFILFQNFKAKSHNLFYFEFCYTIKSFLIKEFIIFVGKLAIIGFTINFAHLLVKDQGKTLKSFFFALKFHWEFCYANFLFIN